MAGNAVPASSTPGLLPHGFVGGCDCSYPTFPSPQTLGVLRLPAPDRYAISHRQNWQMPPRTILLLSVKNGGLAAEHLLVSCLPGV